MRAVLAIIPFALAAQTTVSVDNARVRILNAVDRPHKPGALHRHEFNRVMIYLDDGSQDISVPGAPVEHHQWKAGEAVWSPAGPQHVSENVGTADLRIVEIELKQPGPTTPPARKRNLDPLAIEPSHNQLIFENDQVRVFRSAREAGGREKWHEHVGGGRAVVLLTPLAARVEAANGQTSPMSGGRGDVFWTDGYIKHRVANIGTHPAEMIVVEVK
jgi:oxalate decarboxylase/phosphoglucose isomerase-like protein (cupin superfamily)